MKKNPSHRKKGMHTKPVKKTIVINCFTGEELEVDRRRIQIVDGMEISNTRVLLDNGVTLAIIGEGKYHTLGNPRQRWAEVADVRVLPDGEYKDGELLGWTPLDKLAPSKGSRPAPNAPDDKATKITPKKAGHNPQASGKGPFQTGTGKPGKEVSSSGKLPPRPKKRKG